MGNETPTSSNNKVQDQILDTIHVATSHIEGYSEINQTINTQSSDDLEILFDKREEDYSLSNLPSFRSSLNIKHRKQEIYFDIEDDINGHGSVIVNNKLSGMPRLKCGFACSHSLNFLFIHPCIQLITHKVETSPNKKCSNKQKHVCSLEHEHKYNIHVLYPPDGKFELIQYKYSECINHTFIKVSYNIRRIKQSEFISQNKKDITTKITNLKTKIFDYQQHKKMLDNNSNNTFSSTILNPECSWIEEYFIHLDVNFPVNQNPNEIRIRIPIKTLQNKKYSQLIKVITVNSNIFKKGSIEYMEHYLVWKFSSLTEKMSIDCKVQLQMLATRKTIANRMLVREREYYCNIDENTTTINGNSIRRIIVDKDIQVSWVVPYWNSPLLLLFCVPNNDMILQKNRKPCGWVRYCAFKNVPLTRDSLEKSDGMIEGRNDDQKMDDFENDVELGLHSTNIQSMTDDIKTQIKMIENTDGYVTKIDRRLEFSQLKHNQISWIDVDDDIKLEDQTKNIFRNIKTSVSKKINQKISSYKENIDSKIFIDILEENAGGIISVKTNISNMITFGNYPILRFKIRMKNELLHISDAHPSVIFVEYVRIKKSKISNENKKRNKKPYYLYLVYCFAPPNNRDLNGNEIAFELLKYQRLQNLLQLKKLVSFSIIKSEECEEEWNEEFNICVETKFHSLVTANYIQLHLKVENIADERVEVQSIQSSILQKGKIKYDRNWMKFEWKMKNISGNEKIVRKLKLNMGGNIVDEDMKEIEEDDNIQVLISSHEMENEKIFDGQKLIMKTSVDLVVENLKFEISEFTLSGIKVISVERINCTGGTVSAWTRYITRKT